MEENEGYFLKYNNNVDVGKKFKYNTYNAK
jgi:hypothetical protein